MKPYWSWSATIEAVLEDKLKETTVRARAGELTGTDVRQAESRLARAHASRYQAESTLTQDRASYLAPGRQCRRKDCNPLPLRLMRPGHLPIYSILPETHNPDVISAQFAVEQADAEIRLNRGSLLPEVDLVGNSTRSYGDRHHASRP